MGLMQHPPTPAPPVDHDMKNGPCAECRNPNNCEAAGQCSASRAKREAFVLFLNSLKAPEPVTPSPGNPAPPTYEVYGGIGGNNPKAARVLFKGAALEAVRRVSVDMGKPGAALLTVVIELPADTFIQIKGATYDWRSTYGRDSKG